MAREQPTIQTVIGRIEDLSKEYQNPIYNEIGKLNLVACMGDVLFAYRKTIIQALKMLEASTYIMPGTKVHVRHPDWIGKPVGYVVECSQGQAYICLDPGGKIGGLWFAVSGLEVVKEDEQ